MNHLIDDYRQHGFVILRDLFTTDEVAAMHRECDRLLGLDLIDPANGRTPYRFGASECPERIDPVVDISPLFAGLTRDPRLVGPIQALLGDRPCLFKDKLILKAPGVDGYQMHQDWAWGWQDLCPADQVLSASLQIDGADSANGGIELIPGQHHQLLTPPGLRTNFRAEELARIDTSQISSPDFNPGDVIIFHALAPHRSGRNQSQRWRRSLYLSFNAERAGNLRQSYYDAYRSNPLHHQGSWFR